MPHTNTNVFIFSINSCDIGVTFLHVTCSWQDIGAKGPIARLDLAAVSVSTPAAAAATGSGSARALSVYQTQDFLHRAQGLALLAVLDAFGDVRISLVACAQQHSRTAASLNSSSSSSSASKAVYARVGATHCSGTPKNLCLSPLTVASPFSDRDSSQHVRSFLVLATATSLRIFSLSVQHASGRPLAVTLSFVRKVLTVHVPL